MLVLVRVVVAGVAVNVATLFSLFEGLFAHRLDDLDLQIAERWYKTLGGVFARIVGHLYALCRNVDLDALHALAVEVVVDFVGAAGAVDVGDKYRSYNLLLGLWCCICDAAYEQRCGEHQDNLLHNFSISLVYNLTLCFTVLVWLNRYYIGVPRLSVAL